MGNKPNPDKLRKLGIAPHLVNYLTFVGLGRCQDDCPAYNDCRKIRESFKGELKTVKGLDVMFYCPLIVVNVEGQ